MNDWPLHGRTGNTATLFARLLVKTILFFVLPGLVPCGAFAADTLDNHRVEGMVELPITALKAVEKNGRIVYVSEDGRYALQGQLIDIWHKKPLDTLEEIQYSAEHINLDVMGIPIDQLNRITIPGGPGRVVAFVDPECSHCEQFIRQAEKRTALYTYQLIIVPALGPHSNALAKRLFCTSDASDALTLFKEKRLDELPLKKDCDTTYYEQTLVMAELLQIRAVPYFISPSGRFRAGMQDDFWDWLQLD